MVPLPPIRFKNWEENAPSRTKNSSFHEISYISMSKPFDTLFNWNQCSMYKKGSADFFFFWNENLRMKWPIYPKCFKNKNAQLSFCYQLWHSNTSRIDPGTWIQIFSIFSDPWETSMLSGAEWRANSKGVFLWPGWFPISQVCADTPGEAADPDTAALHQAGGENLSFSAKTLANTKVHCFQECPCLWSFSLCVVTDN